jgi:hypothetical protein
MPGPLIVVSAITDQPQANVATTRTGSERAAEYWRVILFVVIGLDSMRGAVKWCYRLMSITSYRSVMVDQTLMTTCKDFAIRAIHARRDRGVEINFRRGRIKKSRVFRLETAAPAQFSYPQISMFLLN